MNLLSPNPERDPPRMVLKHTATVPTWPATMPKGWIHTTKPTRYGDQLSTVIAHNSSTGLYYAYFIRFLFRGDEGGVGTVDLPAYVDRNSGIRQSLHMTQCEDGWVIDLSPMFGVPTLEDAALLDAGWAEGIGQVLRGKPWPHQP